MNDEAIGEVTATIRNLLQQGIGNDYQVSLYSPWEDFGNAQGVNLFLYKVEENPQWKNMDWPGDRSNPTKIPHPPLSLDLFYLLTPYARKVPTPITDEAQTHRILGKAMQILHENPVLNDIHNPYFNADNNEHFSEDLRNSYEKIRISLNPVDMEEMSKIWSMGDKPYRLSVAYHASLVQITPSVPAKTVAAPVQETGLQIKTLIPPVITKLSPLSGPVGTELHIFGSNMWLKGFRTMVWLAETLITEFISITEDEIILRVPDELKTGPGQKIIIVIDNMKSKSELFRVRPWILSIKPQRGAVDAGDAHALQIDIDGYDLQGVVQMSIGGVAVNPADINIISENLIKTYVPNTLGNGYQDIELNLDGKPANKRKFEVVPLIQNITPSQGRAGNSININGQRLDGTEIRISVGSVVIVAAANANPNQISFDVPKTLSPGEYKVRVTVDGHESNVQTFKVLE